MATIIKFKPDGIDEMEALTLSFSYSSVADVSNRDIDISFQPITISDFAFVIKEPKPDVTKKLLEWITTHEVKGSATFSISQAGANISAREIKLQQVCLTSYSESINRDDKTISLSVMGQVVSVDDVEVDLSELR